MTNRMRKFILIFVAFSALAPFLLFGISANADYLGQTQSFFTDSQYDKYSRNNLDATLMNVSDHAYFYIDNSYINGLSRIDRTTLSAEIAELADEFDNNIYPKEISFWGSEPNPGIDNDPRITVLLEQLVSGNGGYFDTTNEYLNSELRDKNSNQREIVYINVGTLGNDLIKNFLAHEFQHLIDLNQKDLLRGVSEETWLNELRSEYTSAFLEYDSSFYFSSLQNRIGTFLNSPSDSLTEWPNVSLDYAEVFVFGRYLVDQYGPEILSESLKSNLVGIDSINQFLQNHGFKERFTDIYGNWEAADYLNDLSIDDQHYGYKNSNLKVIKVTPNTSINLFSSYGLSFSYVLKPWQPYWQKFNVQLDMIKTIELNFNSTDFEVMYLDNLDRVGFLSSKAYINNPGGLQYFVLMPFYTAKTNNFNNPEDSHALTVNMNFVDATENLVFGQITEAVADGSLIKKQGSSDLYVVEGKYKRYLLPEVIKMYGQLDPQKAITADENTFNSYITSNYIKNINDKKVYAVWPDGTKHWLNMTGQYFTESGRDWNSIFVINDSEINFYKTGTDIKN